MNENSQQLIQKIYNRSNESSLIAINRPPKEVRERLLEIGTVDEHNSARYANMAAVLVAFFHGIEELFQQYQDDKIKKDKLLKEIAILVAGAKNDRRDGMLLVEDLFGVPDGEVSIHDREEEIFEQCETNDWVVIYKEIYSKIFGSTPPSDPPTFPPDSLIETHHEDDTPTHPTKESKKTEEFDLEFDDNGAILTPIDEQDEPQRPKKPIKPSTPKPPQAPRRAPSTKPSDRTLAKMMAELDGLTGLGSVKNQVHQMINLQRVRIERQRRGMHLPDVTKHLVFTGNPGTGKTTIARLIGQIYKQMGVLSKGHFVAVERKDLVGEYIGHTEQKTEKVIEKAKGGILFIDEAYSLSPEDNARDFGQEAIATLITAMENYRDDLVVIAAGYTNEMNRFIESNPGLKSRFSNFIQFDDYNADELYSIFNYMCNEKGFLISEDADISAGEYLQAMYDHRDHNFGNARDVRNFLDKIIMAQATRLGSQDMSSMSDEEINTIESSDVVEAAKNAGIILE